MLKIKTAKVLKKYTAKIRNCRNKQQIKLLCMVIKFATVIK
jgi:hypothetical protein